MEGALHLLALAGLDFKRSITVDFPVVLGDGVGDLEAALVVGASQLNLGVVVLEVEGGLGLLNVVPLLGPGVADGLQTRKSEDIFRTWPLAGAALKATLYFLKAASLSLALEAFSSYLPW